MTVVRQSDPSDSSLVAMEPPPPPPVDRNQNNNDENPGPENDDNVEVAAADNNNERQPRPPPQQQRRGPSTISFTKIILVAVLGGLCLFLQVTVWTLEVLLEERHAELEKANGLLIPAAKTTSTASSSSSVVDLEEDSDHGVEHVDDDAEDADPEKNEDEDYSATDQLDTSSESRKRLPKTYKPSELTNEAQDMHLHRMMMDTAWTGQSLRTQRQAFWKEAVELWLSSWDPNVPEHALLLEGASGAGSTGGGGSSGGTAGSSSKKKKKTMATNANQYQPHLQFEEWHRVNATLAWAALEQAAEMGHPYAQFHVANALASGIYLGDAVQDTWTVSDSAQQQKAWLYWHMAAMGGNVEATLAMASRLEELERDEIANAGGSTSSTSTGAGSTTTTTGVSCAQQLPYYQEAALGIVDALETDPQSRAKVTPASDKHVLYQIHLHGGTPSKLEFHNKADESPDALQFYHLRAMSSRDKETAASAAYTLANYYHHGVRGVPQNITLAAEYYERAALLNHWESSGVLGNFYMWGVGVPQDVYKAHKFYQRGMPLSFAACRRRYQSKLKNKVASADSDSDDVHLCDTESINGMGLLKLFGLPHVMEVDTDQAEDFFSLARDQGSADAAYNHAMVRLGWTMSWKPSSEEQNYMEKNDQHEQPHKRRRRQTMVKDKLFPKEDGQDHPTLAEYQAALTDLTFAAGKGHIQARLRLGMLYAKGIQIPGDGKTAAAATLQNKLASLSSSKTSGSTLAAAGAVATAAAAAASDSSSSGGGAATVKAVPHDCTKALKHFRWIAENACPFRTRRLRRAYKQYTAGDTQASLLNYLAAAETGSTVGLLNAAFLLEQGECLSTGLAGAKSSSSSSTVLLNSVDCAKASARLWKAAANKGHGEASLRVGDFYYYRRFREPPSSVGGGADAEVSMAVGPFGWVRYIIFPEHGLPVLLRFLVNSVTRLYDILLGSKSIKEEAEEQAIKSQTDAAKVCSVDENNPQQCKAEYESKQDDNAVLDPSLESDLEMAAHYYRMATETSDSARAHFNLGFLYEWGLGLKQDFPLAKRHYDLAVSGGNNNEAEIPVAIALWAMHIHEKFLKYYRSALAWLEQEEEENDDEEAKDSDSSSSGSSTSHRRGDSAADMIRDILRNKDKSKQAWNVLISHMMSWESLAVLVLTILLTYLVRLRDAQRQQQDRRP